jgi:hypothetical protein
LGRGGFSEVAPVHVTMASCLRWKDMTRSEAGREGEEAAMLGPFSHTPPPDDEEGKKVARAVAWATLVMGAVMMVLSVVLPP